MIRPLGLILAVGLALASSQAEAACELFFKAWDGQHGEYLFSTEDSFQLAQFVDQQPGLGLSSRREITLVWGSTRSEPTIRLVGSIDDRAIYEVTYTPSSRLLAWDNGDWTFCPFFFLYGDPDLVLGVEPARLFEEEGRDVVAMRIRYYGRGNNETSLFFAVDEGLLVYLQQHLRVDRIRGLWTSAGLEEYEYSYSGRFCGGSLTYESMAKKHRRGLEEPAAVRSRYRIDARELVLDTVERVPPKAGVQYPCAP